MKMSTNNGSVLSKKNDSMLTAVALLVGLVAGIVVQQLTDEHWTVIIYVLVTVFGAYFLMTVPFASNEPDYIPSQSSFRLVWGAILTTVGLLLLLNVYAGLELWIMVVVLLIVIVIIVLLLYMKSSR